ncbi:hypothetical protein ACFX2I_031606 [Malus domestica]
MSAAEVSTPDDRGGENINAMRALYPELINSHLIKSHSLRGLGKQFPSLEAWYGMMESAQEGEGTTEEAKKSNVARKLEKHQQVRMLNPRLKDSLGVSDFWLAYIFPSMRMWQGRADD